MSYNDKVNYTDKMIKPKLVESKVIDKIVKVQNENKPLKYRIGSIIFDFIKRNILYFVIFIVFCLLLLYRYYHVKNKKNRNKKYEKMENSANSTEDEPITSIDSASADLSSDY